MTENRLLIGVEARCEDGACGRVRSAVVDPATKRLMDIAVKPDGLHGGHLVTPDLIASVGEEVVLRCTKDEFVRLEPAQEVSEHHTASWPYTGEERGGGRFPVGVEGIERDTGYGNRTTIRDRIPEGGVEVRRGEPVYATDGEVGRIRGLSIRLPDAHVGHLLLNGETLRPQDDRRPRRLRDGLRGRHPTRPDQGRGERAAGTRAGRSRAVVEFIYMNSGHLSEILPFSFLPVAAGRSRLDP